MYHVRMSILQYCGFCATKHPKCQCPAIAYTLRDPNTDQITFYLRLKPKGFVPEYLKFEVLPSSEFTFEEMCKLNVDCASKGQPVEVEFRQRIQKERSKALQERNQFGSVRVFFECGFCGRKHSNLQCPAIAFTMRDAATNETTYYLRVEPKGFVPEYLKFEVLSTPTEFSYEDMLEVAKEYSRGREAELESLFRQRSQAEQKAVECRNEFGLDRELINCWFCARRHAKLQCPAVAYTLRDPATEQCTYFLRKEPAGSVPAHVLYEVVREPTKYSYEDMLRIVEVCTREGQGAQLESIFKQVSRLERNMASVRNSAGERLISCCFCTKTHVENQCPLVAFTEANPDSGVITFYLRSEPRGTVPASKQHVVLEPLSTKFTVEEMELKVEKYTSNGRADLLPNMFLERSHKERAKYEEQKKQAESSTPRKSTKTSNVKTSCLPCTPQKEVLETKKGKKANKKSKKEMVSIVLAEASLEDLRAPSEPRDSSEDEYSQTGADGDVDLGSLPPTPYHTNARANSELKPISLAAGVEKILLKPGLSFEDMDWAN